MYVDPRQDCLCAEGDLRIVDRLDVNGFVTGALQVYQDGVFGAVCASSFDPVDGDVACRQLGFAAGTALPLAIDRRDPIITDPPLVRTLCTVAPLCAGHSYRTMPPSTRACSLHSMAHVHRKNKTQEPNRTSRQAQAGIEHSFPAHMGGNIFYV